MANNIANCIYTFGTFRVDASEHQLTRDGVPVPLPPKVFDVLLVLVENHGRIVGKDELMARVWADTYVEDANLTVNISALRKALGTDSNGSQYIETIPKRGYRFAAPVTKVSGESVDQIERGRLREVVNSPRSVGQYKPTYTGNVIMLATSNRGESIQGPLSENQETSIGPDPDTAPSPPTVTDLVVGSKKRKRFTRYAAPTLAPVFIAVIVCLVWFEFRPPAHADLAPAIDSIAVLPFESGVHDANAEYLSDGISESLINRLSQLSGLRVASRGSSFRFKGSDHDVLEIGKELKVRAVLTGSVKQVGDQLVIAVTLDDTEANQHVWGEQYVRKLTDIISVQNEIAQDVTSNLRVKLTGADQQKLAKKYTQDPDAYQYYLKGNYEWNKHTEDDDLKAIKYYQQALEIDPNFALAYAGLSTTYGALANVYRPPNEDFPKARVYAEKALELDDSIAEAHGAMGAVRLFYDWDWAAQEQEFKRAQALSPSYGDAHHLYAAYLESTGRFDEARNEALRAQEIDPLSAMFATEVGIVDYYSRNNDAAIEQFEKTLNLEPRHADAYLYLGQSFEQKGMYPEAISAFEKGMAQGDRLPELIAGQGHAYARSGNRQGALRAMSELQTLMKQHYISPYWFAVVYAGLGDRDQTLQWLEKALSDRSFMLIWLNVEPQFDPVRDDPRFWDLTGRIGLKQ